MKLHKIILGCATLMLLATSCEEKVIMPGDNDNNNEKLELNIINATCAEAKEAAMALESGATSTDTYAVTGYVQSAGYSSEISRGQQKYFWIDDNPDGGKVLEAYWCNVPNATAVPVGAQVRIVGKLMNYNGSIAEIKNGKVTVLSAPAE